MHTGSPQTAMAPERIRRKSACAHDRVPVGDRRAWVVFPGKAKNSADGDRREVRVLEALRAIAASCANERPQKQRASAICRIVAELLQSSHARSTSAIWVTARFAAHFFVWMYCSVSPRGQQGP